MPARSSERQIFLRFVSERRQLIVKKAEIERGSQPQPLQPSNYETAKGNFSSRMNIVYFDLETQRTANDVGGWDKKRDMGMSLGVTYSTNLTEYRIYNEYKIGTQTVKNGIDAAICAALGICIKPLFLIFQRTLAKLPING